MTEGWKPVFDPAEEASEHRHVGGEEQGRESDEEPALQDRQHEAGDPQDQQTPPEGVAHNNAQPTRHDGTSLAFPIER